MKARFKSRQIKTGKMNELHLVIEDHHEQVFHFLKKKADWEEKTGWERSLDVEIGAHYRKRTVEQNNLRWELCTRIAAKIDQTPEDVELGIKEIYYPRKEVMDGLWVPMPSAEQTTVQFAQVLEVTINKAFEVGADIYDIWILFTEWRFGQERDPLEGTYENRDDYKEKHPCCEACGEFLLVKDNEGVQRHTGSITHIVSVGSGGQDKDFNWFIMCGKCHIPFQHQKGWTSFLAKYSHIAKKVQRARERCGKKPLDIPDEVTVQIEEPKESTVPDHPVDLETQAGMVKRVFQGEVIEGEIIPSEQSLEDQDDAQREMMMNKIESMKNKSKTQLIKYYEKSSGQKNMFDEKLEPHVDVKKAQHKDDETIPKELDIF
ncbi:MAG: HNH endonuclease [Patescibacteria group bacterium]|nr:HNH endonuclease [Patescibacteria group bacterium]